MKKKMRKRMRQKNLLKKGRSFFEAKKGSFPQDFVQKLWKGMWNQQKIQQ